MRDKYSVERVALLHPLFRMPATAFIDDCENSLNITLRITEGFRSFATENEYYAQGRTKPGSIITNAQGGQSFHNYGLAIDVAQMVNNDTMVNWAYDDTTLKPFADKHGLEWGGSWRSIKDKPHFQKSFGYTWQQLLALHNAGKVDTNGYVIIPVPNLTPLPSDNIFDPSCNDDKGGADPLDM